MDEDYGYEEGNVDFFDDNDSNMSDIDIEEEIEESGSEVDEDEQYIKEVRVGRQNKYHERIKRHGIHRYQNIVFNKYERVNAIKGVAALIAEGKKVHKCAGDVRGITDTISLAEKVVDNTSRSSLQEPVNDEEVRAGSKPIIEVHRPIGVNYIDVWYVHELVDFNKKHNMSIHNSNVESDDIDPNFYVSSEGL